jgi:hypothetical protein
MEALEIERRNGQGQAMASTTLDSIAHDALALPVAGRALLVEKLLASLEGQVTADTEEETLQQIERRREAVSTGKSKLIDGDDAVAQARAAIRK